MIALGDEWLYSGMMKRFLVSCVLISVICVSAALFITAAQKGESSMGGKPPQTVFLTAGEEIGFYTDRRIFSVKKKAVKSAFQSVSFLFPGVINPIIFLFGTLLD